MLLVFDGDNTLWDTSAVYDDARRELLTAVSGAGRGLEVLGLDVLAGMDRELARQSSDFEYRTWMLSAAAWFHFREELPLADAICAGLAGPDALTGGARQAIDAVDGRYAAALRTLAIAFTETANVLAGIRVAWPDVRIVLFSEGMPERVRATIDCATQQLGQYFDEVVLRRKSPESWAEVKAGAQGDLSVLVGDSLDRDIAPGKAAGFVTVYRPSAFLGWEQPRGTDDTPDYTIRSLDELPEILRGLV